MPANVSLTMIVRDEEANLPRCLASAAGLFAEVVVADTGSTDRTREIARASGAKVIDVPWTDDFAAARNAALDAATGDYAMWLDADDEIMPMSRGRLADLFRRLRGSGPAGYSMFVRVADGLAIEQIRLFPLRPDVRWSYRVHEAIHPALARAGIPIRRSDSRIWHHGYDDPRGIPARAERNARLLAMTRAEHPGDAYVMLQAGRAALGRDDAEEAARIFEAGLAIPAGDDFGLTTVRTLADELGRLRAQ